MHPSFDFGRTPRSGFFRSSDRAVEPIDLGHVRFANGLLPVEMQSPRFLFGPLCFRVFVIQ